MGTNPSRRLIFGAAFLSSLPATSLTAKLAQLEPVSAGTLLAAIPSDCGTLDTIAAIDCVEAWCRLSADAQARVGALAIRQALFDLAGSEFEGDIVYLKCEDRDEADQRSLAANREATRILWDELPDLFGKWPSDEHPNGTDPWWATPMTNESRSSISVEGSADK